MNDLLEHKESKMEQHHLVDHSPCDSSSGFASRHGQQGAVSSSIQEGTRRMLDRATGDDHKHGPYEKERSTATSKQDISTVHGCGSGSVISGSGGSKEDLKATSSIRANNSSSESNSSSNDQESSDKDSSNLDSSSSSESGGNEADSETTVTKCTPPRRSTEESACQVAQDGPNEKHVRIFPWQDAETEVAHFLSSRMSETDSNASDRASKRARHNASNRRKRRRAERLSCNSTGSSHQQTDDVPTHKEQHDYKNGADDEDKSESNDDSGSANEIQSSVSVSSGPSEFSAISLNRNSLAQHDMTFDLQKRDPQRTTQCHAAAISQIMPALVTVAAQKLISQHQQQQQQLWEHQQHELRHLLLCEQVNTTPQVQASEGTPSNLNQDRTSSSQKGTTSSVKSNSHDTPTPITSSNASVGIVASSAVLRGSAQQQTVAPLAASGFPEGVAASSEVSNSSKAGPHPKYRPVFVPEDVNTLTDYQILIRKNIEFFETMPANVGNPLPGRKVTLVKGQVGIRCVHCRENTADTTKRSAAATSYFPTKLHRLYHSAQAIAVKHLARTCPNIDQETRAKLLFLNHVRQKAGVGREYWSLSAKAVGVVESETDAGLCFVN